MQRPDQESLPVYQLGYHVGLKGQYSGVCSLLHFNFPVLLNVLVISDAHVVWLCAEQRRKVFYPQSPVIHCQVS
jgi:hypothetical protein